MDFDDINGYNESLNNLLNSLTEDDDTLTNAVIVSAYTLIIIISVLGNTLVCKVSFGNRTTTNLLIASLSVSDLLVTVFNIPFNVTRLLMDEWPFGQTLCFLVPFVQITAVYVSSLTMAAIAIHRWRSVMSVRPMRTCSTMCVVTTIMVIWSLAAILSYPLSMFNTVTTITMYKPMIRCRNEYPDSDYNIPLLLTIECFLTQYFIPLSLACIIYSRIAIIITRQGQMLNSMADRVESTQRSERKRRRILMLVLVVVIFAICWLPINVYHVLIDSHTISHNYNLFVACHWFAMSSVCYNPFIYCWLNSTFRAEVKKLYSYINKCLRFNPRTTANVYQFETIGADGRTGVGGGGISGSSPKNLRLALDVKCVETNGDNIVTTSSSVPNSQHTISHNNTNSINNNVLFDCVVTRNHTGDFA